MQLTEQSTENVRASTRAGIDSGDTAILVWVERIGNRSYLQTEDGPVCCRSVAEARRVIRKLLPDLLAEDRPEL